MFFCLNKLFKDFNLITTIEINNFVFTVIIHKEEDMFIAEYPDVQTISQGDTIDEAIKI